MCSKLNVEDSMAQTFFEDVLQNATVLYPNPLSLQNFKTLLLKYKPKGNRVYESDFMAIDEIVMVKL